MARLLGILLIVVVLYGTLVGSFDTARSVDNHVDLARRLGFYGVLTLGVGTLIITGGIDLSIGSLVGLVAVAFGMLLERQVSPWLAAVAVLAAAPVIGLIHGLLVTGLGLQPFLVTLCGLFAYRGLARQLSEKSIGLSDAAASVKPEVDRLRALVCDPSELGGLPGQLVVMLAVAVLFA